MASIQHYFSMKWMAYWNWIATRCDRIMRRMKAIYHYQINYTNSDTWFFIKGHTLPLCQSHMVDPVDSEWTYVESTHTLTYTSDLPQQSYRFSWLSAKIVHVEEDKEYDIDSFLEQLRIHSTPDHVPTLTIIFQAWCIYAKKWFPNHHIIQFHIINNMAEEQLLSLKVDANCLVFHGQKIDNQIN